MEWTVEPARCLSGEIRVPGDKSISHRALLLAGLADGVSVLEGLADGDDVASTGAVLRALGVSIEQVDDRFEVVGRGLDGWRAPTESLDCGNSGTTMRLLAGLLAGKSFESTLTGDASLRRRPMSRVALPLRGMGANVRMTPAGTAPLVIAGRSPLRAITFRPEVASAQVKSCVLLAGLLADGDTTVVEAAPTRDHTECLLHAMGADIQVEPSADGNRVTVRPAASLEPLHGKIPGDISSAAYWIAAAAILAGSRVRLPGVGTNPTRAAILDLLSGWGARVEREPETAWSGEPGATITIEGAADALSGGEIAGVRVPGLIDELPLLAALGPFTREGVEIREAAELRVKESDRIATTAAALRALGAVVDEYPDGLAVAGGTGLGGGTVDAAGDHRIALAMAVAALAAREPVTIMNAEAMAVSYPGFAPALETVARR